MSPQRVGRLTQVWYKWKALHLPWRKRFLVGYDLNGNTFWTFRLTNNPGERWRRIVQYPRATHHSQVKVTPQWHSWLRYTRDDPPTIEEQQDDVVRQSRTKKLAAEADARWEAKPRLIDDAPSEPDFLKPRVVGAPEDVEPQSVAEPAQSTRTETARQPEPPAQENNGPAFDPWAQHKPKGPGETWQPGAWDPSANKSKASKT